MAKAKTIILAGAPIEVPFLPIRLNKIAYPLCRKLHNEGLLERVIAGKGALDCSASEMDDLTDIAYVAVCASNPRITREEFDNWPITPPELIDAFFIVRYQTGGWIAPDEDDISSQEGEDEPGEAQGQETPQT